MHKSDHPLPKLTQEESFLDWDLINIFPVPALGQGVREPLHLWVQCLWGHDASTFLFSPENVV